MSALESNNNNNGNNDNNGDNNDIVGGVGGGNNNNNNNNFDDPDAAIGGANGGAGPDDDRVDANVIDGNNDEVDASVNLIAPALGQAAAAAAAAAAANYSDNDEIEVLIDNGDSNAAGDEQRPQHSQQHSQQQQQQQELVPPIDIDGFRFAGYRIKQYAESVIDFSSQYGSDYSISYTAQNLIGRPTKYPEYGDFAETFAMRTYGDWWLRAPSRQQEIQPQNMPKIRVHDYIVVSFEDYVLPEELVIFETFNPGAIVRIWAYTITKVWVCLWECEDFDRLHYSNSPNNQRRCQHGTMYGLHRPRRFVPPINRIQLPTKVIRLEFNHKHLQYFTEIDAIMLCGRTMSVHSLQQYEPHSSDQRPGSILRKVQRMQFRPELRENYLNSLHDFYVNDLSKFMNGISSIIPPQPQRVLPSPPPPSSSTSEAAAAVAAALQSIVMSSTSRGDDGGAGDSYQQLAEGQDGSLLATNDRGKFRTGLRDMPFEIIMVIFGHLDLISLFRASATCRFFYEIGTHPLLYTDINLKPYWHLANTKLLHTLAKRSTVLRRFDLSWCGLFNAITPTEFKKFVQQRGDTMTHLRLNSCKFLNASCIETLGIVCDNLRELSLRNCNTDPPLLNFSCLANLKHLERLDLFQTVIEPELLLTMLESNRKLKHLNLAFCGVTVIIDDVAQQIGRYNHQLITLDMWKSHFLSSVGLMALSNCVHLEELDVGWCLRDASLGDSLKCLISNCPNLRKLFLATVRGVTDSDVHHIANNCPKLEQLDLMGVLNISKERYIEVLRKCKKLELLDLSFCDNVKETDIINWTYTYNVNIKFSSLFELRH